MSAHHLRKFKTNGLKLPFFQIKNTCLHRITVRGRCFFMRNFRQCLIIMTIVFIAIFAVLETDRRCGDMYDEGGHIAEVAVNVAVSTKQLFHE